jgi:hypothetical protein
LAFAVSGRVASSIGEELDAVRSTRLAVEGSANGCVAGTRRSHIQNRKVLQPVWPRIGVSGVVWGHAVVIQIDAQTAVGENAVSADDIPNITSDGDAGIDVERDEIAAAGRGGIAGFHVRVVDQDAVAAVTQRQRARDIGADVIPLDNHRIDEGTGPNAVAQIPRDDIAGGGRIPADDDLVSEKVAKDAVALIGHGGGAGGVGADAVALNRERAGRKGDNRCGE